MTHVHVVGLGMGPHHLTAEGAAALAGSDYVVAVRKRGDDELLEVRRRVAADHGLGLVEVVDPERDRDDPADYPGAVAAWHDARADAWARVLTGRGGTATYLVWGDPSLYDSTLRVLERAAARVELTWDVVPGISAPQVLAARHRVVLHEVGQPVHLTTARRLAEDLAAGQENLLVMLGSAASLDGLVALADWRIWWGANLGAAGERLVAGRVGEVLDEVRAARAAARDEAGWVMDCYLLRAPR
ncbi:precorrin-6A synthase (deacetylating) [Nocardioides sp. SOB77]|uniref:Precorrin-6A synthase (Deacetylating) n=1 Tax=Nocardioides oceani TaxID=3058369 RepID=A0ABT8FD68_9ACTN|nr:precorrin-6A synthase (deacetylating) [Nocardioides oceani]MDN4172628.1 precorrin-6A synthase (deacetylating) [Nocardioides oceani]